MSLFALTFRCRTKPFILLSLICVVFVYGGAARAEYASTEDHLQAIIDDVPVGKVPGIILLVEGADVRFHGARGWADRKAKTSIRMDNTLRAGSICKTYVGALSVMAVNEGLIDFDLPIDRYLGAEVLDKLPKDLRPTIRQLLNHTSGVPDYYGVRFYLKDWVDRGPLTTELVLHAIRGKKATNIPGEQYSYSNTNYHLMALILEEVYQVSLEALLEERIFKPLDLQATYYNQHFPPGDKIHGYGSPSNRWKDTYQWQENTGPDGGMIASAADLAIWMRALFAQDGRFYEIGATMAKAPVVEGERKLQGMGVEILQSRSGVTVMGHTGSVDGYLTAAFYVPATDTVMVLHMNKSDTKTFGSVLSQTLKIIVSK